jgi:LmbE family N-acetylglucosaminyl deacetylase
VFFGDGYVSHVDHRAIGWATVDAIEPAAKPLYFPEHGAVHQVSRMLLSPTLEPDVWIDVTSTLDAKVTAVLAHRSQLPAGAEEWLPDFVRHRAEEEGRRGGLPHAEAFRRLHFG